MPRSDSLGQFEQLVLTLSSLGETHTGSRFTKTYRIWPRPRLSLWARLRTLDRLEDKGLVSSWLSEPIAARGGRAKRCYRLEASGERALKESIATARRMASSVRTIWGDFDKELGNA